MATDIAFAVGVLTILGKRVHPALRILLLAFAIIDDIGAILIIAIFYSSGIAVQGLILAAAGLLLALMMLGIGVRPGPIFTFPLLVMWAGLYQAGIHPTIAGVVLGLVIPVKPWYGREGFLNRARSALDEFQQQIAAGVDDHELLQPLGQIQAAGREAVSAGVRGEAALHPWVAFGIMPLFALANAGVNLGGIDFGEPGAPMVFTGITLGLLIGKPVGVVAASWIVVKLRLTVLPLGVTWRGMLVVSLAAAIGFTMAIFISELAFSDPDLLAVAKLGVLAATAVAGAGALILGRVLLPKEQPAEIADVSESTMEMPAVWSGETKRTTND